MRNLKYDRNELIYKTEQESQTQKTYVWLPKGKGGKDKSGGWAEHTHTTTHKTDNQQPTNLTWGLVQTAGEVCGCLRLIGGAAESSGDR